VPIDHDGRTLTGEKAGNCTPYVLPGTRNNDSAARQTPGYRLMSSLANGSMGAASVGLAAADFSCQHTIHQSLGRSVELHQLHLFDRKKVTFTRIDCNAGQQHSQFQILHSRRASSAALMMHRSRQDPQARTRIASNRRGG
jgi:hypothetical protein